MKEKEIIVDGGVLVQALKGYYYSICGFDYKERVEEDYAKLFAMQNNVNMGGILLKHVLAFDLPAYDFDSAQAASKFYRDILFYVETKYGK